MQKYCYMFVQWVPVNCIAYLSKENLGILSGQWNSGKTEVDDPLLNSGFQLEYKAMT